jgi:hypothetical protein
MLISSITPNRITIEAGSIISQNRVGQYGNSYEFRAVSSLISAIGSAIDGSIVFLISSLPVEALPTPWDVRGGGTLSGVSFDRLIQGDEDCWTPRADESGAIFLLRLRENIEECAYQHMEHGEFFVAPDFLLSRGSPSAQSLEVAIRAESVLWIKPTFFDIEIEFSNQVSLDLILRRTARVIDDFNQMR